MGNDWNSTDSNNEIVLVSIKGRFDKISNQAHWFMAETILTIEEFEGKYILYEHQQGSIVKGLKSFGNMTKKAVCNIIWRQVHLMGSKIFIISNVLCCVVSSVSCRS